MEYEYIQISGVCAASCTWYHVRKKFVESLQTVASTQTLVVGNIHPIDAGATRHPVHTHLRRILYALEVSLLAFPHTIYCFYKEIRANF